MTDAREDPASITGTLVERYLAARLPAPDALLERLEGEAAAERIPILPPSTAALLELLVAIARPERALEIGTAIGYSAIRLARALPRWGNLDTIELDLDVAARAEKNLAEAGLWPGKVTVLRGRAIELLPLIQHRYDFVFIDADKSEYEAYLALALKLMPKGAVVVVDNLLWGGRAASGPRPGDEPWHVKATEAIQRFNLAFTRHPELRAQVLPVGDGVGVGVKV